MGGCAILFCVSQSLCEQGVPGLRVLEGGTVRSHLHCRVSDGRAGDSVSVLCPVGLPVFPSVFLEILLGVTWKEILGSDSLSATELTRFVYYKCWQSLFYADGNFESP